ncbi:unnamed protein product [Polarella glacialis]|uniref:Uncharacterized protein n=1 Tax=Polarella glacialis TaxID=89957 RepID=A0A813HPQ8_POLGL|nr:unnamed protein product [Polarella glacialis]
MVTEPVSRLRRPAFDRHGPHVASHVRGETSEGKVHMAHPGRHYAAEHSLEPGSAVEGQVLSPDLIPGLMSWNTAMSYEQLLAIQQRQHVLVLEHKEAELAHLKACMFSLEDQADERCLAEALRTKDEEAALMMAAKHKELELMVGLLHLREQQIEDLRSLCEEQQLELEQRRGSRGRADKLSPCSPTMGACGECSSPSPAIVSNSRDESSHLRKEIQRLRLRMEELEASLQEQHQCSALLADELQAKTDRIEALEEELCLPFTPSVSDHHERPNRCFLPEQAHAQEVGSQNSAASSALRPPFFQDRDMLSLSQHEASLSSSANLSQGHRPVVSRLFKEHLDESVDGSIAARASEEGPAAQSSSSRGARSSPLVTRGAAAAHGSYHPCGPYHEPSPSGVIHACRGVEHSPEAFPRGTTFPRHELPVDSHIPSGAASQSNACSATAQGERAANSAKDSHRLNRHSVVVGYDEAVDTGRQSQELLREMRRLRIQMSELERAAGGQAQAGARNEPSSLRPMGLGAGLSSLSGLSPCSLSGSGASPAAVIGASGSTTGGCQQVSGVSGRSATLAFSGVHLPVSETQGSTTDLGAGRAWEYRPHTDDPLDQEVANLVNQPGGRYRGWRALLCRLERGIYLCGTRRVHIRADSAADAMEASDDGGATWADLEVMMRGAEASQHALLQRAKGALGLVT